MRRLSFVLLCLASLARPAISQTLYGVTQSGQLLTIDTSTGVGTLKATLAPAMQPWGVAFRGRDLYVADFTSQTVRQVNPDTGAFIRDVVTISLGASTFNATEGDVAFGPDGTGYVARSGNVIHKFNVMTGAVISWSTGKLFDGLAFDNAGTLYGFNNTMNGPADLYTIDATGTVSAFPIGTTVPIIMTSPTGGMAFHPATNQLFIAVGSASASTLFRVDKTTGVATPVGLGIGFASITGISFRPPPPPPPPEGTFAHSSGPPGPEGAFGFGAISRSRPRLTNPVGRDIVTVRNVAPPSRPGEGSVWLPWAIVTGIVGSAVLLRVVVK